MSRFPRGSLPPRALPSAVLALLALLVALLTWPASSATAATPSSTYQAESAALSGGAVVGTDHTGYTGTGFVGGYTDTDKGAAATTFTVSASAAGSFSSTLRYANGTTATQTLSVYVNGTKITQIALAATADWNTWGTQATTVALKSGNNTVAYKFDSSDSGNVNLDDIVVGAIPATPSGQYEAESAALSGGAVVGTDHTGYTGTGFVGGYTDANKGNASTTFTVTSSAAGTAPVALRYSNGSTITQTLAVYVNGTKALDTSLAATADWNTWTTKSENLTLKSGSNTIAYKYDTSDTGNVNLDNITVGAATGGTGGGTGGGGGTTSAPGQVYQASDAFFTGGPSVATSLSGYTGSGYLTGFTAQGAQTVIDTNVPTAGNYPVAVGYANSTGSAQTVSLYLDGVKNGQISLPSGSGWEYVSKTVALRSGLNVVSLQTDSGDSGNVSIDNVVVNGGTALPAQGATLPYTEYRAAAAQTNGTVLATSSTYPGIAAESTGRSAVQLKATGQYVQFTLTKPANSVVVRYSIPDTSDGSVTTAPLSLYANGTKVQDLTLTNKYSWLYGGGYYDTNAPSDGSGHHFYDDVRALSSTNWPTGTVLKLQKDAADTAASYTIDTLDAEQVDAAFAMPANYVSVTGYGVTPNSGADDTSAINSALSALSGTGKGLWFPAGTYDISGRVNLSNVSLRGAGEWYTTIQATAENGSGGLYSTGGRNQIADLSIFGDQTSRNNDQGAAAIEGTFTSGSLLFDVWMEHTKVGLWAVPATGMDAAGLRARDIFADGLHVHGGSSNSRIEQSSVRNTGDDSIALDTEGGNVTNCTVAHNTLQSPIQANGVGVYGGSGNTVQANVISDTVAFGAGIKVSTQFGGGFTGPTSILNNLLQRTGSHEYNNNFDIGALWIHAVQSDMTQGLTVNGNTFQDSQHQAILLDSGKQISNLSLDKDTITNAGSYGFDINNVTGSMSVSNTTVTGAKSGGLNNPGNYTINRGSGDSGF